MTEKINRAIAFVEEKAEEFGAGKNYIRRNYTSEEALNDSGAYFGLIHPEEEISGPYHDFSLTVMPSGEDMEPWLVTICVGSSGFKNDYELATFPGLRRLFSKLVDENGYCKSDFSDIETNLPRSFRSRQDLQHISHTIDTYKKVLSVCQIVKDSDSDEGKRMIAAFVAGYAKIREWPSNAAQRNAVEAAVLPFLTNSQGEPQGEVKDLLLERRFVVLQGPPGTGKTRLSKRVAEDLGTTVFFTQFHAETTFSDFVYGLRPNLKENGLGYIPKSGILTDAIKFAGENADTKVLLIIDEINRANLSNVLGPVFYLFEPKMELSNFKVEVSPDLQIEKLPDNFYVIATMNTADRSLAVLDFALRRRFAWYDLKPAPINGPGFFKNDFIRFQEIFNWFATTEELSLQPGQGYFMASTDEEMKNRLRYELFPLIKEYLREGLMRNAKEDFNDFFTSRINLSLYE